jgi:hypothetical protein
MKISSRGTARLSNFSEAVTGLRAGRRPARGIDSSPMPTTVDEQQQHEGAAAQAVGPPRPVLSTAPTSS